MMLLAIIAGAVAMAVALDWAFFWRITHILPRTSTTGTAYRDYFFPRAIFIAVAGGLVACGCNLAVEPTRTLLIVGGAGLFLAAHGIQYYWFVTD